MSLRLYFSGIRISTPYLLFNLVKLSLSKKKEEISGKGDHKLQSVQEGDEYFLRDLKEESILIL